MTATERTRRWRSLHRKRLPWPEDHPGHAELAEWERGALDGHPKEKAEIIPLRGRRK